MAEIELSSEDENFIRPGLARQGSHRRPQILQLDAHEASIQDLEGTGLASGHNLNRAAPEWGWSTWFESAVLSDQMHIFHRDCKTALLQ